MRFPLAVSIIFMLATPATAQVEPEPDVPPPVACMTVHGQLDPNAPPPVRKKKHSLVTKAEIYWRLYPKRHPVVHRRAVTLQKATVKWGIPATNLTGNVLQILGKHL